MQDKTHSFWWFSSKKEETISSTDLLEKIVLTPKKSEKHFYQEKKTLNPQNSLSRREWGIKNSFAPSLMYWDSLAVFSPIRNLQTAPALGNYLSEKGVKTIKDFLSFVPKEEEKKSFFQEWIKLERDIFFLCYKESVGIWEPVLFNLLKVLIEKTEEKYPPQKTVLLRILEKQGVFFTEEELYEFFMGYSQEGLYFLDFYEEIKKSTSSPTPLLTLLGIPLVAGIGCLNQQAEKEWSYLLEKAYGLIEKGEEIDYFYFLNKIFSPTFPLCYLSNEDIFKKNLVGSSSFRLYRNSLGCLVVKRFF